MRTTIQIHDDVIQRARELAEEKGKPFRYVINEALRTGLEVFEKERSTKPYSTEGRDMGLKEGISLDNVQDVLTRLEEEESH